jgi:Copper type II ascorbate-dependent monooxygenase, C-terminal domain
MLRALLSGLFLLAIASCDPSHHTGGFAPATPDGTGANGVSSVDFTISWHQDKRSEIVECHYLKTANDAPVELDRLTLDFPDGSHHVHIYRSDTPEDDGVKDCTAGIDWRRWSLLVGAQTKPLDWVLPDGITAPLPPHQQLLVQVHWLNTTDAPIDRQIHVGLRQTTHSSAHLGVALGVSKDTYMLPRQQKTVAGWVPVPPNVKMVALMGHFHARGKGYVADLRPSGSGEGRRIYEAQDEQTFEFKQYADEPVVQPGEGIAFACDFENTTDGTLTWGPDTNTQEHCNLAAYYYPAGEKISTVTILGELKSVTATPLSLLAGEGATGQVELQEPAGPVGVDVELVMPDRTALQAPATVHVPAWTSTATFSLQALRPTHAVMHATSGDEAQAVTLPWDVGGLLLSEIYYKPDAPTPDGRQWIEIANTSSVDIDLSHYSVGAGVNAYADSRVWLGDRMLPARGCLVVGGPTGIPDEDMKLLRLSVAERFQPVLPPVDNPAAGVGLFDVQLSAALPADAVPLDALVYGSANPNNLLGSDGKPAAAMGAVPAGASMERTTTWQPQPTRSPGTCQVLDAH